MHENQCFKTFSSTKIPCNYAEKKNNENAPSITLTFYQFSKHQFNRPTMIPVFGFNLTIINRRWRKQQSNFAKEFGVRVICVSTNDNNLKKNNTRKSNFAPLLERPLLCEWQNSTDHCEPGYINHITLQGSDVSTTTRKMELRSTVQS